MNNKPDLEQSKLTALRLRVYEDIINPPSERCYYATAISLHDCTSDNPSANIHRHTHTQTFTMAPRAINFIRITHLPFPLLSILLRNVAAAVYTSTEHLLCIFCNVSSAAFALFPACHSSPPQCNSPWRSRGTWQPSSCSWRWAGVCGLGGSHHPGGTPHLKPGGKRAFISWSATEAQATEGGRDRRRQTSRRPHRQTEGQTDAQRHRHR